MNPRCDDGMPASGGGPSLLRVGSCSLRAAADRAIDRQRSGGGRKAAGVQVLFQLAKRGEAVGIDPDRDRGRASGSRPASSMSSSLLPESTLSIGWPWGSSSGSTVMPTNWIRVAIWTCPPRETISRFLSMR